MAYSGNFFDPKHFVVEKSERKSIISLRPNRQYKCGVDQFHNLRRHSSSWVHQELTVPSQRKMSSKSFLTGTEQHWPRSGSVYSHSLIHQTTSRSHHLILMHSHWDSPQTTTASYIFRTVSPAGVWSLARTPCTWRIVKFQQSQRVVAQ